MQESPRRSGRWIAFAAIAVFAIAFFLRLPSCYESFWLDELHSAWVVWDGLSEVTPRSIAGHQSPFYFLGLWCWKQLVGDSEVALRLSSVLAVASACSVVAVGIARWSRSTIAGATAGLILAVESNSIFFGTELRPYAFVILFASIAVVLFLRLCHTESRHEDRRLWSAFLTAILLATLCQPTAIGVLAWLPTTLICVWFFRNRKKLFQFTLIDGILGLSVVAIGLALWQTTLSQSWHQRGKWASFASATGVDQLWQVWDWTPLVLAPLAVALVACVAAGGAKRTTTADLFRWTCLLAVLAITATSVFWIVSRVDMVPIWHRRFFIAVLPILACVAGGGLGTLHRSVGSGDTAPGISFVIACLLAGWLVVHQGKLTQLKPHPVALVTRGEDWRGAAEWVRSNANPHDGIYLDAALIESQYRLNSGPGIIFEVRLIVSLRGPANQPSTDRQAEYLAFPLLGPYRLQHGTNAQTVLMPRDWSLEHRPTSDSYLILRRRADRVSAPKMPGSKVIGFGGVSVIFVPGRS